MAKHTEAEFRNRWDNFASAACLNYFNTHPGNVFNTQLSLYMVSAEGNTQLEYYPDYDDNENLIAVFYLNGDDKHPVKITWNEMAPDASHSGGRRKLWTALVRYYGALVTHWSGLQEAIDLVNAVTTVTAMGNNFGPDGEDSRTFMVAVSDAYHKHDIHT